MAGTVTRPGSLRRCWGVSWRRRTGRCNGAPTVRRRSSTVALRFTSAPKTLYPERRWRSLRTGTTAGCWSTGWESSDRTWPSLQWTDSGLIYRRSLWTTESTSTPVTISTGNNKLIRKYHPDLSFISSSCVFSKWQVNIFHWSEWTKNFLKNHHLLG